MFKIGDKVRFLDEVGEGIIHSFKDEKTALVELVDSGLIVPYLITKLLPEKEINLFVSKFDNYKPQNKENIKGIKKVLIEKEAQEKPKVSQKRPKKKRQNHEIDLHIEELVDKYSHLSNGQILEIQLQHFRINLEKAIQKREHSIVFIHGVGNGVLKAEIRKILSTYEGISFQDASFKKYGYGATEVIIH